MTVTDRTFSPQRPDDRLWSSLAKRLTPYVPGEQPKLTKLCKLNTNENPFPPSPQVVEAIQAVLADSAQALRLYPDPHSSQLKQTLANYYQLDQQQVFVGNGSDEVLAHIFAAFFIKERPLLYPDITYSFYPVYAEFYGVTTQTIPLRSDLSIEVDDYRMPCGGIIIANPNAPTGISLASEHIEKLLVEHPNVVIVIDEAYVDFGGESVIPLIHTYSNLVVTQTLSKSRSLAGLRVGAAFAHPDLIAALDAVKDSFNSYPVDRLAQAGAIAAIKDKAYFESCCQKIIDLRHKLQDGLMALGFEVLPSATNFLFVTHPNHDAALLAQHLREKDIILRHFNHPRINQYLRITVGTQAQQHQLLEALFDRVAEHTQTSTDTVKVDD